MPIVIDPTPEHIAQACVALKQGKLVAIPTETVYGLAANATDDKAVARIFEAKGRPSFNPLIIHIPSLDKAETFVTITPQAEKVAEAFWPGPLTMILPQKPHSPISKLASSGLQTLAIRMPSHPVARALLKELDFPLAAPSANRSGHISPTNPSHVMKSLGDKVDFILADGQTHHGVESTIIDLSRNKPVLLRYGSILKHEIEAIIGPVLTPEEITKNTQITAPGQLESHYAPHLPVRLNVTTPQKGEAFLTFGPVLKKDDTVFALSDKGDLIEAAANLFKLLYEADNPEKFTSIAVMPIPRQGLGLAINDRLTRAAADKSP